MFKQLKKLQKDSQGFTLVELMIVVAIIGILAAIAIPNFMRYQLKAKTAEAKSNLKAIATSQVSYKAEKDGYVSVPAQGGNETPSKVAWIPAAPANLPNGGGVGTFEDIGFRPSGDVYYLYASAVGPDTSGTVNQCFTADAIGDLDGNRAAAAGYAAGTHGAFGIADYDAIGNLVNGAQVGVTGITNTQSVTDVNQGQF